MRREINLNPIPSTNNETSPLETNEEAMPMAHEVESTTRPNTIVQQRRPLLDIGNWQPQQTPFGRVLVSPRGDLLINADVSENLMSLLNRLSRSKIYLHANIRYDKITLNSHRTKNQH